MCAPLSHLCTYTGTITVRAGSNIDNVSDSLSIRNYYDFNINLSVDYVCNGGIIGDQLKTIGTFTIPNYLAVKRVRVRFSGTGIDDEPVLKLGNYLTLRGGDCGSNDAICSWSLSGTYSIRLNSSRLTVSAGASNWYPGNCYMNNASGSLRFYYD